MKILVKNAAILFFGMAVFSCCEKENIFKSKEVKNSDGVVIEKNSVWKIPTSNSRSQSVGGLICPIVLQGNLLTDFYNDAAKGNSEIQLLNLENQNLRWKWNDYITPDKNFEIGSYLGIGRYIYNDNYIFHTGPRTYCIDLNTGKTKWKSSE